MKSRLSPKSIPILLAIMTLAASNLACRTGINLLDMTFFPQDYWDQHAYQELGRPGDPEPQDTLDEESAEPQGEFVPPVGSEPQPVAPQSDAPTAGSAPVITDIDFPSTIPADGTTYFGWISFTDAEGDVDRIRLHVVHSTTPMNDAENPPGTLEGTPSAGRYRMGFYCTIPSLHTMQVTLFDAAGNTSNSMDFSWECR